MRRGEWGRIGGEEGESGSEGREEERRGRQVTTNRYTLEMEDRDGKE